MTVAPLFYTYKNFILYLYSITPLCPKKTTTTTPGPRETITVRDKCSGHRREVGTRNGVRRSGRLDEERAGVDGEVGVEVGDRNVGEVVGPEERVGSSVGTRDRSPETVRGVQ